MGMGWPEYDFTVRFLCRVDSTRAKRPNTASAAILLPATHATVPSPGQVESPTRKKLEIPISCGRAKKFVFHSVCLTPPTAPRSLLVNFRYVPGVANLLITAR